MGAGGDYRLPAGVLTQGTGSPASAAVLTHPTWVRRRGPEPLAPWSPLTWAIGARDYVRGNDPRTGRRAIKIPAPECGSIRHPDIEPLAGHARNLTGNHPSPGCGRNRRRARARPASHQLNHLSCGESRCSAARCHHVHADGGIRAGAARSRPARCQRSCRPGKAPGHDHPPASGRFAPGTAR